MVISLLMGTLGGGAAFAGMPPIEVGVITAQESNIHKTFSYTGRVISPSIVNLQARITGFLVQRYFHQGTAVKKGELLYLIEPGPYLAAYDQAKAQVVEAKAQLTNAKLTLTRAVRLLHTPAGQQSAVDNARAAEQSDKAALAGAKAALESASINLGYTQIHAPITGRIGATQINVGNLVSQSSGTLATIVSENPMNVEFSVPAREAARLLGAVAGNQGLSSLALYLRLPDGHMYRSIGHLVFTGNQISPNTDSLNLVGRIPNPIVNPAKESRAGGRELISGEFVTVLLRSNVVNHGIVVPRAAVLADQLGDYVLTVGPDNKVKRQPVTLAASTPAKATISAGVAPGTKIIVSGIQKVHPGLIVKPVPESASLD